MLSPIPLTVDGSQLTPAAHCRRPRHGLTLIEVLIALTMTLVVLGAMMSAFSYASSEMQTGRSIMELANRLRVAESLLREDLLKVTVDAKPYTDSVRPNGFIEIIEGPNRGERGFYGIDVNNNGIADKVDFTVTGVLDANGNRIEDAAEDPAFDYLSDLDDILTMTCRATDHNYTGRFTPNSTPTGSPTTSLPSDLPTLIESPLAEIIWWTDFRDDNGNFAVDYDESVDVFRRVLLIRPDLNVGGSGGGSQLPTFGTFNEAMNYLAANDISARIVPQTGGGFLVFANSLGDLASRQNRFARMTAGVGNLAWPHPVNRGTLALLRSSDQVAYDRTLGQDARDIDDLAVAGTHYTLVPNNRDLILTEACGFDIKVFSPNAVVQLIDSTAGGEPTLVEPHDSGFQVNATIAGGVAPNGAAPQAGLTIVNNQINGAFVDLGHRGTFPTGFGSAAWFSTRLPTTYAFAAAGTPNYTGGRSVTFGTAIPGDVYTTAPANAQAFNRPTIDYQFRFDANLAAGTDANTAYHGFLETVWDSWTPEYEIDQINQDADVDSAGNPLVDESTDGLDIDSNDTNTTNAINDGPNGLVDDPTERETVPPYNNPLRGIKISIRVVDKNTDQVRQTSIRHSFVPQ